MTSKGTRACIESENSISVSLLLLVYLLYVDYGELFEAAHRDKKCSECVKERLHASVNSYVGGLEITGGGCKPSKCHWWTIGFRWKAG